VGGLVREWKSEWPCIDSRAAGFVAVRDRYMHLAVIVTEDSCGCEPSIQITAMMLQLLS
jgi:hypothetical protein